MANTNTYDPNQSFGEDDPFTAEMRRLLKGQGQGQAGLVGQDTPGGPAVPPATLPTPASTAVGMSGDNRGGQFGVSVATPGKALPTPAKMPVPVAYDPGEPTGGMPNDPNPVYPNPGPYGPGPAPYPEPTTPGGTYDPGPTPGGGIPIPPAPEPWPQPPSAPGPVPVPMPGTPAPAPVPGGGASLLARMPRPSSGDGGGDTGDTGGDSGGGGGDQPSFPAPPIIRTDNPSTDSGGGQQDWATADYSNPANIRAFFQSKGITDPGQLDRLQRDWSGDYQRFGQDKPYFFARMSDENDLTGSNSRGGGSGGGGGQALPPLNTSQYQTDPMIQDAIRRLLAHGSTTPSGDDPEIRAQFNPQNEVIQRNNQRAKAAAAERNFASGQVGAGANDTDAAAIDQASGLDASSAMGQLVAQALVGRREEYQAAINFAQGEEKLALQQYLANIDAELRKMGLDLQGRSLDQQNSQFYDQLGVGIGNREADYNQALLALLSRGGN